MVKVLSRGFDIFALHKRVTGGLQGTTNANQLTTVQTKTIQPDRTRQYLSETTKDDFRQYTMATGDACVCDDRLELNTREQKKKKSIVRFREPSDLQNGEAAVRRYNRGDITKESGEATNRGEKVERKELREANVAKNIISAVIPRRRFNAPSTL